MKRTIVKINEELCDGCGACVTGCHEGAIQIINDKAVLVSEAYCDGLGDCIGECPQGAITLEVREAEAYDEVAVKQRLAQQKASGGCPGSMAREIKRPNQPAFAMPTAGGQPSELRQFPVQLHLLTPGASFLQEADLLLAADCTAFSFGSFHSRFLRGKALAIACPKLDSDTDEYVEKLAAMIDEAHINTLTVLIMEVPCCNGLLRIARAACEKATRKVPIKQIVLSISGDVIKDEWIQ